MVFDGPVYCDWAENLNSMLDDNRKLCLNSGETLELTDNTSLIFEVADLKNASPSTVNITSSSDFQKRHRNMIISRFHELVLFISSQTHWIGNA